MAGLEMTPMWAVLVMTPYVTSEGSNSIDAGEGNDTIYISSNNAADINIITGGTGSDTYVLSARSIEQTKDYYRLRGGAGGDILDIGSLLTSSTVTALAMHSVRYGYLRLLTESADTLLQWDQDGAFDSTNGWQTLARLQNVDANTLTAENFVPLAPHDGSTQDLTITGTNAAIGCKVAWATMPCMAWQAAILYTVTAAMICSMVVMVLIICMADKAMTL